MPSPAFHFNLTVGLILELAAEGARQAVLRRPV
jgi:hypothetical protein